MEYSLKNEWVTTVCLTRQVCRKIKRMARYPQLKYSKRTNNNQFVDHGYQTTYRFQQKTGYCITAAATNNTVFQSEKANYLPTYRKVSVRQPSLAIYTSLLNLHLIGYLTKVPSIPWIHPLQQLMMNQQKNNKSTKINSHNPTTPPTVTVPHVAIRQTRLTCSICFYRFSSKSYRK